MKKPSVSVIVMFSAVLTILFSAFTNFSSNPPQAQNPDKGIGPFQNVTLAPLDKEKAKKGMAVFNAKCMVCHDLDANKVGPPIRNSVKTYTPEFIMNMIVNPTEMQKSNATTKELLKKYNNVPMTDQKISKEEALIIFEYLRSVVK